MIHQHGRLLDPGAGMGAHVQSENSGIHARKKVLAQKWDQQQRGHAKGKEPPAERQAMGQYQFEQIPVAFAKTIEGVLKSLLETDQWLQPLRES